MRKFIITLLVALGLVIGGFVFSSPAQAHKPPQSHKAGCVTKSEYNRIFGMDNIYRVQRVFGSKGTLVKTTVEHTQELYIWFEDDENGKPVLHSRYDPYFINHYVYKYDKCSAWGHHKQVTVWYETWEMPEGHTPVYTDGWATLQMRMRS